MTAFAQPCCRLIANVADLVCKATDSVAGSTLGGAATLGVSCTLGDDASVFASNMALSCRSADVAVVIMGALAVDTGELLRACWSASAATMAAYWSDKVGVVESCRKNSTVSEMRSACVMAR
jgi:hypothetical protein